MKNWKKAVFASCAASLFLSTTGCTTVSNTKLSDLVAPGLAIGGSTLGMFAARDKNDGTKFAATAGGGLIGWLIGLLFTKGVEQEKKDEFKSGYELGQANATKSLYWQIQLLHQAKNQPDSTVTYYQIPADYPADGAKRTEGSVILPIVYDRSK